MKNILHSPWFLVAIVIAGISAGYGIVMFRNTDVLAAWECPAMENCEGNNCENHAKCASGECSKDCPVNCDSKES